MTDVLALLYGFLLVVGVKPAVWLIEWLGNPPAKRCPHEHRVVDGSGQAEERSRPAA